MEQVKQLLRGEPVYIRGLIVAVLTAVGVKVSSGAVDDWLAIIAPILLAVITRPATTPSVNPAPVTTIAVKPDEAETPAEQPPVQLPPILTITGQRR